MGNGPRNLRIVGCDSPPVIWWLSRDSHQCNELPRSLQIPVQKTFLLGMIQVAAAVEALLRQGKDPVTWTFPWRFGSGMGSCESLMSMMFHVLIMVGWSPELGWIPHFVSISKRGSSYFWVSRSNFKPLGSLCFTSFGRWMRFMVKGSYQWHQNVCFFSENTLISFLSFSFFWQERKQIYTHHAFYFYFWVAGHVKKERIKVKPGSSSIYLNFQKKRCLHFCVSPNA